MARGDAGRGLGDFARVLWRHWLRGDSCPEGRPDSNDDAVGLLTMHAAKGLEWPIVMPVNAVGRPRSPSNLLYRRNDEALHFSLFAMASRDHVQALEEERAEGQRERVRLWYVAMTRARDLLLFPRHRVRLHSDWLSPVAANVDLLPRFAPDALRPPTPSADPAPADTAQDAATWSHEAGQIATSLRRIRWNRPSRHEAPREAAADPQNEAFVVASCGLDVPNASPRAATPLDGAARGMVLHKLLEEVLTGETVGHADALCRRAGELLLQIGLEDSHDSHHRAFARLRAELARCVLRTLALPQIAALESRLLPEVPLYARRVDATDLALTAGIADAVALDEAGHIDVIIDWKSDHSPAKHTLAVYRRQMRGYLRCARARLAMLVFLSTMRIERVTVS